ncbi:MAG: hypothetical protein MZW92_08150 [Comamonadaceae bacterium]|nr:hypothetical protein [Comamonadaceae bacterium]
MFNKPEDFAKSGFNFALFFANTTFDGIERLALLNLAAARSVFEVDTVQRDHPAGCQGCPVLRHHLQKDLCCAVASKRAWSTPAT